MYYALIFLIVAVIAFFMMPTSSKEEKSEEIEVKEVSTYNPPKREKPKRTQGGAIRKDS